MPRMMPSIRMAARIRDVATKRILPQTSGLGKVIRDFSTSLQNLGYGATGGGNPLQTGAEALGKGGANPLNPAGNIYRTARVMKTLSSAQLPEELVSVGAKMIDKAEKRGWRRSRGASGSF